MTNPSSEQWRKIGELKLEFLGMFDNPLKINENPPDAYSIADWWLGKLRTHWHNREEELRKNITSFKDQTPLKDSGTTLVEASMYAFSRGYNAAVDRVLALFDPKK